MQLDASEAHAVHAVELEEVLDAGTDLIDFQPAFELERAGGRPAFLVGLELGFLGDALGNEDGRGAGVEDQVERPLAVDFDPNQHVLGVGEPVRDLDAGSFVGRRFRIGFGVVCNYCCNHEKPAR